MKIVRSQSILGLAAAVTCLGLAGGARGQILLQHTNSIDLSSLFNATSNYGNNSLSVAFDGTNAYVGGYNNTGTTASVGVVKVSNVLGAAPSLAGLASTQVSEVSSRGIDSLAFDTVNNRLYVATDTGSASTSYIAKYQPDGTLDTTFNGTGILLSPDGLRPNAIAIDPIADSGGPAVAMISQSSGRRIAFSTTGSVLYGKSGDATPGALTDSSPSMGFTYRGIAFDSTGRIALTTATAAAVGNRTNANQFSGLDGSGNTTRVILKQDPSTSFVVGPNNVGIGTAFLEGVTANPLLVLAPRASGAGSSIPVQLLDSQGNTRVTQSGYVQLSNLDGTTTGLLQTALTGAEDTLGGGGFATELKNFAVGKDATGQPVLVVATALQNRLDVYSFEPVYTADADGTWGDSSKWMLGVVPDSNLLNAHFQSVNPTSSHTITLATGRTTKDLKLDSPLGYTVAGPGTLTLSSPSNVHGAIQAIQGSNVVSAPIALAMPATVEVSAAADLTITSAITGSGTNGLTKSGTGVLNLNGNSVIGAGLKVTGGTLNVNGALALSPNGTNAGTGKVSNVATLNINGSLDLANNDLVVSYTGSSPIDSIRDQLQSGKITTSMTANGTAALGYAESTDLGVTTFSGVTTDASSVVLKYTYLGDMNLDGKVDADDYVSMDRAYALQTYNPHWQDGDFNYDGLVDVTDYHLMDRAFALQGGVLTPGLLAERQAQFGSEYISSLLASVPEPGIGMMLGFAPLLLTSRRRARRA